MTMNKRFLAAFATAQAVGEIAFWSWERLPPQIGVWLWGLGLILLFPGNFVGAMAVEKLLWNRGLSLIQLSVIEIPVEIVINLIIWMLLYKLVRFIWQKLMGKKGLS
jgi:hypothetical protein